MGQKIKVGQDADKVVCYPTTSRRQTSASLWARAILGLRVIGLANVDGDKGGNVIILRNCRGRFKLFIVFVVRCFRGIKHKKVLQIYFTNDL